MHRSAFHSFSYFIHRKVNFTNPKGIYFIEKSTSTEVLFSGDPRGNRTPDTAVKGRCLNRLTNGPYSSGNSLLSRAVSHQVSSTLKTLTSVFGMGTGVSSSLSSPDFFLSSIVPSKLNNTLTTLSLTLFLLTLVKPSTY